MTTSNIIIATVTETKSGKSNAGTFIYNIIAKAMVKNRLGIEIPQRLKLVLFGDAATDAAAVGFAPGDWVYTDQYRNAAREFEGRHGEKLTAVDTVCQYAVRLAPEQATSIQAQLRAEQAALEDGCEF